MNKLFTLVLAASAFGLANAATQIIGTAAAFKSAMTTDPAGDYELTADIDLTDVEYSSIATFSGSLNGASHTISGLGAQALFQDCSGAVTNVTIDGTIDGTNTVRTKTGCGVFADTATGASLVGCVVKGYTLKHAVSKQLSVGNGLFVGTAYDGCSFERCVAETGCILEHDSWGGNSQGGIVGAMLPKLEGVQGVFSACTNRAQISSLKSLSWGNGDGGMGGMVGLIKQPSSNGKTIPTVTFESCVNEGDFVIENDSSQTSNVGGMVGHVKGLDYQTSLRAYFVNCVNLGKLAVTSYSGNIGGIVGCAYERAYLSFDSCVNRGDMGSYRTDCAGGIMGYYYRGPETDSLVIRNCANYGKIMAGKMIGGLLAYCYAYNRSEATYTIVNSANYGEMTSDQGRTPQIGELICTITKQGEDMAAIVTIDNCWRKGETNAYVHIDSTCTVTETNEQTAETEATTAASELSTIARATAGYVQWGIGDNDYPELFIPGVLGPEPEPVAALSDANAVVAADGCSATFSVTVTDTTVEGGVLKLVVNDKVMQTWDLSDGTFAQELIVHRGQLCEYSFVAEEQIPSSYTTVTIVGTPFTPIGTANWFDVKFADEGYVPGATWMKDSTDKSGGTWSGVDGETVLDADTRTVSFVATPTAPAYYKPKTASKLGAGVLISGKMLVDDPVSATPPSDVPFAFGFELDTTEMAFKPVAFVNGVKTAFGTASFAYNSWADFTIEGTPVTDENAWQIKVTVGSTVSDVMTVTVPTANAKVSSLGYSGGSFGDLSGVNKLIRDKTGTLIIVW